MLLRDAMPLRTRGPVRYVALLLVALTVGREAGMGPATAAQDPFAAIELDSLPGNAGGNAPPEGYVPGPYEWSPQFHYRHADVPPVVMRIAALGIETEVLRNTATKSLMSGVGHIEGMAFPGEPGQIALAGFGNGRLGPLSDIRAGEIIELATAVSRWLYEVDSIEIIAPTAMPALGPTARPGLTLVTCAPFHLIESVPWRVIVHAHLISGTLRPTAARRETA